LRLRLIHGSFQQPPALTFVRINMARVLAIRTIRGEVLESIDGPDSNRLRLKYTPVVPKSVSIAVDATPFDADDQESDLTGWKEVDDLTQYGPEERVFVLEPETGVVTFGDGVHGLSIPLGFRNVRAESYQVGGGARGAVDKDTITNLLNSATLVTKATNPLPASGGVDAEGHREAVSRGPETFRSGLRAVTVADYAVWARFVPGADVRKAHALAGFHPLFPGQLIPGVVGILVVPPVNDGGPPIPDEHTLRAVSSFLSERRAPVGVEIVAGAPTYRRIRSEIGFIAETNADVGAIIRTMMNDLDGYLHPLRGGDDCRGWSFGRTLVFSVLMRRLLSLKGVRAVPRLRLIVDGVPQERCGDVPLAPTELFWPERHQIVTLDREEGR
jgi:predicted phage baseplate assembly protein